VARKVRHTSATFDGFDGFDVFYFKAAKSTKNVARKVRHTSATLLLGATIFSERPLTESGLLLMLISKSLGIASSLGK
jgi:hypothetical protein